MKSRILIANWKLYLDVRQSRSVARSLRKFSPPHSLTTIVCPSVVALPDVAKILRRSSLLLGAQNIDMTGEHSANDAQKLGCTYAIVGHSSRRAEGETDAEVAKKLNLAQRSRLTPVLCVGESALQHKAGRTNSVIDTQLSHALKTFRGSRLIIAYEPVWAISQAGKGVACPPKLAFTTAGRLRTYLRKNFQKLRITLVYGGSVSFKNIADYVDGTHFAGVLVGFASTKPAEFQKMAKEIL